MIEAAGAAFGAPEPAAREGIRAPGTMILAPQTPAAKSSASARSKWNHAVSINVVLNADEVLMMTETIRHQRVRSGCIGRGVCMVCLSRYHLIGIY